MAADEDLPVILNHRSDCLSYLKSYKNIIEQGDKKDYLVVCEIDGHIAGSARLDIKSTVGTITRVVTSSDNRKNGIGSSLVRHLIDYAKSRNLSKVELRCLSKNYEFYHRLGFVQDGPGYIENNLHYRNMKMEIS